ncbi:MAG: type VI secretion system tube protein TssD [Candidatus Hodarchaeales archaeon]|jgi:type VI secretion system secreted protein Hcp
MISNQSIYRAVALVIALGLASSFLIAILSGQEILATENSINTSGYQAYSIFMTITGNSQGNIDGDVDLQGKRNTIEVLGFSHRVAYPTDPNSGQIAGQRKHYLVRVVKPIDSSTPKLAQAFITNEYLYVTLKFYRVNTTGHEEQYYTIELEDAIVVSIQGQGDSTGHSEALALTYRKIRWIWVDGVTTQDDWQSPQGG